MLFSHGKQSFNKLAKAFEEYKIESAVIDIALDYLDIEKDRNNALLDRIPRQNFINDWRYNNGIENAMKSEIISKRNQELKERFILLTEAFFGCNSSSWLNMLGNYYGVEKIEKEIVTALSSRYGDKAEACYYAIYMSQTVNFRWSKVIKSPEICVDAVDFVGDNPAIKALLCAKALSQLPEQEKNNPIALRAVECIKEISVKFTDAVTLMAVGEGAYFDDELKNLFGKFYGMTFGLVQTSFAELNDVSRIFRLIEDNPEYVTAEYIKSMAEEYLTRKEEYRYHKWKYDEIKSYLTGHFETLALNYTDLYVKAMKQVYNAKTAKEMREILIRVKPDYPIVEDELREKTQRSVSKSLAKCFVGKGVQDDIRKYLLDGGDFYDIKVTVEKCNNSYGDFNGCEGYIEAYGIDDFFKRIATVMLYMRSWNPFYFLGRSGFEIKDHPDDLIDILMTTLKDSEEVLRKIALTIEDAYQAENMWLDYSKAVAKRIEDFADISMKDMSVSARWIYVTALATADREKYKSQILSVVGDSSKKVKEALIAGISIKWHDEIVELLQSKKIGIREMAVSVIEKKNDGSFTEEITKAFEKEKSEKLKSRLAVLLGTETTASTGENSAKVDIVASLVKGAKGRKVAFLFEYPYKTVHFTDGSEVPEDYLKALIILYSDMISIAINNTAMELAGKINPDELNDFTMEVFRRWADKGATAKTKWVMWFCGVHGGHGMTETLMKYIKEWSEHSRGAIASEAVIAMAVNGSSEALMNVDSIARKFKHKQVKNAANKALDDVAGILGITKEELADKIVPDMDFNDEMCRVFDYGNRQFKVYLTPELEIEIFNGDKKVKNLPKPAKSDDEAKATKAYEDFKIMKKQIKSVVANQKQRLEYVLMCDRKWTCENWTNLFVKNPVMHCFAIGLIWGIYDGDKLVESFRYMDDGSFTNIEEDEFEIPENAEIGLVHPIELTDEQKESWAEQLSDYEITQPFPQISRPCFKPTEQELNSREITRFEGITTGNYNLRGKLIKMDWSTGCPQDAGWFMEFVRDDVIKCVKNPDGTVTYDGFHAEIEFSGMGIDYMEAEDVTLGTLFFKNYNGSFNDKKLKIKDVNPRYFSEVIMQLSVFENAE